MSEDPPSSVAPVAPSEPSHPNAPTTEATPPLSVPVQIRLRLQRLVSILTWPFMVIFTIITLVMLVLFCIFPILLCMMFGICIYYCLMEDPIPFPVLLRYMLSPDAEDATYYPNLYPLTQQRPVIQSKLIIRKLLRVEGTTASSDDDGGEYPRKHPFPIQVTTNHKCLHFSEPLLFLPEEEEKDDDKQTNPVYIPHHLLPAEPASNTPDQAAAIPSEQMTRVDNSDDNGVEMVDIEIGNDSSEETPPAVSPSSDDEEGDDVREEEIVIPIGDAVDETDMDHAAEQIIIGPDDPNNNNVVAEDDQGSVEDPEKQLQQTTDSEKGVQPVTTTTTIDKADYFGVSEWSDRGTACDICLLEYQVGDAVAWSPNLECSHSYHKDCVLDWLVRKPTCPNCRHDYLKGKGDEDV